MINYHIVFLIFQVNRRIMQKSRPILQYFYLDNSLIISNT